MTVDTGAPTEVHAPDQPRLVRLRTLVVAVFAAAVLSIGGSVGISYVLIGQSEPGPRGPAGERGPRGVAGPVGPAGEAEVDSEDVFGTLEEDPQRITDLVQDNLDPNPSELQSGIDDVASDLTTLCEDLNLTDALYDEYLSCP